MLEDIYLLFSEILKECFFVLFGYNKVISKFELPMLHGGLRASTFYIYNNVYSLSSGLFNV